MSSNTSQEDIANLPEQLMETEMDTQETETATAMNQESSSGTGQAAGKTLDMEASGSSGATGGPTGIDKLLQQQKNEIMYELRRMKLGDRPVTGQGNKEAVESFFERLREDHSGQTVTSRSSEQHRPEEVTVEVNALVERRPVSSVLQSAGFRTNLESALRQALSNLTPASSVQVGISHGNRTASPRGATAVTAASAGSPPAPPLLGAASSPSPSPVTSHSQTDHNSRVRPREAPHAASRPPRQAEIDHNHSAPTPQQAPSVQQRPQTSQSEMAISPVPDQWLQHQASVAEGEARGTWVGQGYLLEEAQREDFIAEISDLVQRELVTSSLRSRFRDQLEHMMTNRLRASNTDGVGVRQVIQNLPGSGIPRNDFSHLGINVDTQGSSSDNLDDMSVISATAAVAVPYAQNAAMSRELASVKSQLQELRSMMRLSFDLQLDIQRAIRQEVAAAVSSALADVPSQPRVVREPTTSGSSGTSQPIRESQCLICIDAHVDSVLYQCGHMCVCYKCGLDLRSRNSHCPVCRAPIRDIIRAYRSNQD